MVKHSPLKPKPQGPRALTWLRQRQSQGHLSFTLADAVAGLGRTPLAVSKALRRLSKQGLVVSPRRGYFVVVPGAYAAVGAPPASWFIDSLMAYLGQPYYVGLLTAAAHHGASHQAAQVFQVVTDRPTRPIAVGRQRIVFTTKASLAGTPTTHVNTPSGTMTLSTPESTALDLVRYHKSAGHLGHVATVLEELAEQMSAQALRRATRDGRYELTVVQRLGYLLEQLGAPRLAEGLAKVVERENPQTVPLRADRPRKGCSVDPRWRVAINADVRSEL